MRKGTYISLLASFGLVTSLVSAPAFAASTEMVERVGRKIAFHVTPGHLPVIVLDAGGGLDSSYWDSIVPELAKRTGAKIITYDRPGFGASDEVPGPWSLESATADLERGLEKLGADHDVILVSHSIAGEIATSLTRSHPWWFKGAVLVDANVPPFFTDPEIARANQLYEPLVAQLKAAPPTPQTKQLLAVSESFVATSRAFHAMTWPASVPVQVIVSEKTPFDTPEDAKAWREAEAEFAKSAPNRKLIIADHSSHDVAHDRPDIILQAVEAAIGKAH